MFPLAFVGAFLVTELIEFWVPMAGLTRPMIALGVVTLLIQATASRRVGRDRGAFIAAMIVMAAFDLKILGFLYAVALVLLLWTSLRSRRLSRLDWPRLTRTLNVIGVGSLALALGQALVLAAGLPGHTLQPSATDTAGSTTAPDIYLILLDGYPRADTLRSAIDYDNSTFLNAMKDMGFDIAQNAHSNYNRTTLTVTSMLNANSIDALLPNPPGGTLAQHRLFSSLINDAAAVDDARSYGYSFVNVPTQLSFLAANTADQFLDSGELTQFEYFLDRNGGLSRILPDLQVGWFRAQHRDRVLSTFASLARLPAERAHQPRLVFAHVMAPHNPIVFRADGSMAAPPDCYWNDCVLEDPLSVEIKQALAEQVEFTSRMVEQTARGILQASEQPPVIVIFGDHGFRHWASDRPEAFQNLFLSYTPGQSGLFPDNATPINIIPRLLNAYVDAGLPLASEESWVVGNSNGYFPLRPWDGVSGPTD